MYLNTDIILKHLQADLEVIRSGCSVPELVLHRPVFARGNVTYEPDHIYIGQPGQLPQPERNISCLIICVGGRLPAGWDSRQACTMVLPYVSDMFYVFNLLTKLFDRYDQWEDSLRRILDSTASIAEMIQATAELFDDPICLCNNRLEIEAMAGPEGAATMEGLGLISEKHYRFFSESHAANVARREPFIYEINGLQTYNINIYKQGTYLGHITLGAERHPLDETICTLFQYFFQFVSRAAEDQSNVVSGQFVTAKSIAHDLLQGLPVEAHIISRALGKEASGGGWRCAAVAPASDGQMFSASYLSLMLESKIPGSFALYQEPYVALFIPVNEDGSSREMLAELLPSLDAHCGLSEPFTDIRKLRTFYRQAVSALETGVVCGGEQAVYPFADQALNYVLQNSIGELSLECVVPQSLRDIRQESKEEQSVDYWGTLKTYLDNETNAALTARELFIHRTTLHARLERICRHVALDTPAQRLFVRYCIYLCELLDNRE